MAIKINGSTVISDSQEFTSTSTVSASGNVTGGNIRTAGSITATGNITGGNVSVIGTVTAAGINTGSSPISTTGNVIGGNVLTGGQVSATGNITGGNVSATNLTGTLLTASQTNITSVGTLGSLAVTGNTSSGNFIGTLNGSGANVSLINANNISSGTLAQARLANAAVTLGSTALTLGATVTTVAGLSSVTSTTFVGALTGAATSATTAGTVTTAAQPNITSVGTMSTATITTLSTSAITKTGSNGVGNIGQTDNRFNTIFATATSALYADLAEKYTADADYAPGTVLVFGGSAEVTVDATDADPRVAGVVSTNPAYIMNDGLSAEFVAAVALTGRVPCLVTGTVRKGDLMVTAGLGRARAEADPRVGTVIGKALENHDGELGTIEVVVGRF